MPEPVGIARDLVERAALGERVDLGAFLRALEPWQLGAVESWARGGLAALPPLEGSADEVSARRRRALRWLAADAAARRGLPGALLALLESDWLEGGASPLPYLRAVAEHLGWGPCARDARIAAQREDCPDRFYVQALLEDAGQAADPWAEALVAFVADPTPERWAVVGDSVPAEIHGVSLTGALRRARWAGVPAEVLDRLQPGPASP